MKYNFDEVIDRIHDPYSYSAKWSEKMGSLFGFGPFPEDRICVETADMDFRCPPCIIDALVKTAQHGIFGYSVAPDAYYKAVSGWFRRRFDWEINPKHIFIHAGTHAAISDIMKNFTKEGDGIVVLTPCYSYHFDIDSLGRKFISVPLLKTEGGYEVDYSAFEDACKEPSTTCFIMCQPHNPTGKVFTPEEMEKLAEICRRNKVLIISDEVHIDIYRKGVNCVPMMKAVGPQGIVTATAVNKTFNVAGLAMTNTVIADDDIRREYLEKNPFAVAGASSPFGISAVIAAYTEGDDWVDELNAYIDDLVVTARALIAEKLPKAVCSNPEGTYVITLDLSAYGFDDDTLSERLQGQGIIDTGLKDFDAPEGNQLRRVCLVSPKSVVIDLIGRYAKAMENKI